MEKKSYVKITIEAPGCEAKALANSYFKNEKYEVVEKAEPKPMKCGMVKIDLQVMKKTRMLKRKSNEYRMRKEGIARELGRMNVESLMSHAF